ncbi:hypothetical protein ACIQPR_48610 [Streptomyces sp. NPDC091280]|uniref:hypothetical protein n=1 Tax=Streptomyces sp. NPDC091280 TaxID=3365984 RepID=UPI0037FD937F
MLVPPPETCTTLGCHARATHLLDVADEQALPGECRRVRDAVCEECGLSYLRTNHVRRLRPVLLRDGSSPSRAHPRIRLRVQSEDEPDAYTLEDWEDADAAAIRAGRDVPLVIEIIDGAGDVLADVPNRIGLRNLVGVYERPEDIHDPWVQYFAADHWTPCFGIEPGDLAVHRGVTVTVLAFEQVDQDYGPIGANTGFVVCTPTGQSAIEFIHITELTKVWEIAA